MKLTIEKLPRFRGRAMAAFIVDDLSGSFPEDAAAFRRYSQWACEAGLKGEVSVLLGLRRTPEGRAIPQDKGFIKDLLAAKEHLDANMEVMSHNCLYDFAADRLREGTQHEGIWLLDRSHNLEEYVEYFRNIARRAAAEGFKHSGLTLPGCGCQPCADFYSRGKVRWNAVEINPAVHEALLWIMSEGLLAGRAANVFVGSDGAGPADAHLLAEKGGLGVYDVCPGVVGDHFGRWDNNPEHRDVDFYITEDGLGGRLPQLLAQGTRTLVVYGHWQSQRPDRGIGFSAFREFAARLTKHYADQIVWMRPSDIAAYRHTERHTELRQDRAGARGSSAACGPASLPVSAAGFELKIPFEPLHPLTFRVNGGKVSGLRGPGSVIIRPAEHNGGSVLFDLLPQNGYYRILE